MFQTALFDIICVSVHVECGKRAYELDPGENETTFTLSSITSYDAALGFETYHNNEVCVHTIITTTGSVVGRIQQFDLEIDNDYLLIGLGTNPGSTNSILTRLTGKPKLRTLTAAKGEMWITFVSDYSGVASGYIIDFSWMGTKLNGGIFLTFSQKRNRYEIIGELIH